MGKMAIQGSIKGFFGFFCRLTIAGLSAILDPVVLYGQTQNSKGIVIIKIYQWVTIY